MWGSFEDELKLVLCLPVVIKLLNKGSALESPWLSGPVCVFPWEI